MIWSDRARNSGAPQITQISQIICSKWMNAPKSAGFVYARPERQALLHPLIVSWGWESETPGLSPFIDYFEWRGTHDPAAYLSVPAAIDFIAGTIDCHAIIWLPKPSPPPINWHLFARFPGFGSSLRCMALVILLPPYCCHLNHGDYYSRSAG